MTSTETDTTISKGEITMTTTTVHTETCRVPWCDSDSGMCGIDQPRVEDRSHISASEKVPLAAMDLLGDAEDREAPYAALYLIQHDRETGPRIHLGLAEDSGMYLTIDEARQLVEAINRLVERS